MGSDSDLRTRPNVVFVMTDDQGYGDLSCTGNPWLRTPHIDRFAEQALVFDRAYAGSFPTIPMRTDMITGKLSAAEINDLYDESPLEDRLWAELKRLRKKIRMMKTGQGSVLPLWKELPARM